jgi:hypothetical protein
MPRLTINPRYGEKRTFNQDISVPDYRERDFNHRMFPRLRVTKRFHRFWQRHLLKQTIDLPQQRYMKNLVDEGGARFRESNLSLEKFGSMIGDWKSMTSVRDRSMGNEIGRRKP